MIEYKKKNIDNEDQTETHKIPEQEMSNKENQAAANDNKLPSEKKKRTPKKILPLLLSLILF